MLLKNMQPKILIRSMRAIYEKNVPISPILANTSSGLGIRAFPFEYPDATKDLPFDAENFVYPSSGGLSTSSPPKTNLPFHHLNNSKKHIFCIETSILGELRLKFRQDPGKHTHYFIEPIAKMLLSEYEKSIKDSLPYWYLYLGD